MISRRLFLGGMLVAGSSAPSIVTASSLMKVRSYVISSRAFTLEEARFEIMHLLQQDWNHANEVRNLIEFHKGVQALS